MKTRKFGILFYSCVVIIALLTILLGACAKSATAPTSVAPAPTSVAPAPTSVAPAPTSVAPAPTSVAPAPTSAASVKTIKIGFVGFLQFGLGLDGMRTTELMIDMVNQAGGLNIGGQQYKFKYICYDNNNSQVQEVAGINRLIYQDNMKYIITSGEYAAAWGDIADENKVIALGATEDYDLSGVYNYVFGPSANRAGYTSIIGFLCENHPELMKSVASAYPDNMLGHQAADGNNALWKAFNITPTDIFYPSQSLDLSSLGTKVKTLNPTAFGAQGGGPSDAFAINAAYNAGYRGQFIAISPVPTMALVTLVGPDAVEGLICGSHPIEFDPALTQQAKDFKAAWIAKYGKWEGPETNAVNNISCLFAAFEKAGTLDTDKIASVIGNGLKFESPNGIVQMVTRPDLSSSEKTTDSVSSYYMKQIKGGQPNLLATISVENALKYYRIAFPPKQ